MAGRFLTSGLEGGARPPFAGRWAAAVAVGALLGVSVFGCASGSAPTASSTATAARDEAFAAWRDSTESLSDDLLAEARRLGELGDTDGALDRIDDALCAALDPPEGFAEDPRYLSFVSALLADAEVIEHGLDLGSDELGEGGELVALPPIEVQDEATDDRPPVDANGLPVSDFPLVLNSTVESFLSAMTGEGEYRRRIATGLERSGAYLPMIRSRFEAAGLPAEISYLPLIESAFSVKAYSRARAHGMWQFMSATGRHYGLEVGSLVDERRDPVRSTEAAIAYLSDLYAEFGDWHLALAAYNSGAGNVRRAIRRAGSHDFWTLKTYLPRETRNYVPAFIASVIIAKDPDSWGFPRPVELPWDYDRVEVPDALDLQFLADRTSLTVDELRDLNPAIRRDLTPANRVTTLWLPPGDGEEVASVLAATPRSEWAPRMIHTVRRGESLSTIAARYGSNVSAIKQANGLSGSLIHPGQSLIVPRFGVVEPAPERRAADDGSYVVQHNDTLWNIARAFNVSLDELCATNGLGRREVIRPGQRLQIPSDGVGGPAEAPASGTTAGWTGRYTVRSGDTLSGIADRHRVSVAELKRANGLRSSRIYPGNTLAVPSSAGAVAVVSDGTTTYRVRKGDTLYDIARQFGVSVQELRRINGLSTSRIYPGDVLRIPSGQAKG